MCTFGTEGAKSSIRTAARGLEIDDDIASYLTTLIPNERGQDWSLQQCYYGDEEHTPIKSFIEAMNKEPLLWKVASKIENLVTRLGCHASGVLALNDKIWKNNGIMKTSKGILVTAFELEDTEQLGGVKYDYLTVQALDKIRTCLNWMLEDEVIEWQGSLKSTYNKYIHPDVINKTEPSMYDSLYNREIPSCFQFDTPVGNQAVQLIHPSSLLELATGNSVMRLMSSDGGELPLNTYAKFKSNINLWYKEMKEAGLNENEQHILEKYLLPLYGVADSQEVMMLLSMDSNISGFTIGEANILRKAVAKKKKDVLEKGKNLFYEKGINLGTSMNMLDYVWNVQIMRQAGYSFSVIHTTAYSYIALQEMNLSYFYPSIYWKTACLSVDAGAVNEEDYYNLINSGIINIVDDEDKREQNKVQYGKIAAAISKLKDIIKIELPDINLARFGFTPDVEHNSILFGLKGISRVGDNIINEIILNRPYKSLQDFVNKMITKDGKKIISKDKIVNLIKAGAFDRLENKSREQILTEYIKTIADQKEKLNLQNYAMLIKHNLLSNELDFNNRVYNFTKYIRKFKFKNLYLLDEIAQEFYYNYFDATKIKIISENGINQFGIEQLYWDSIYNSYMNKPRQYIKDNQSELLTKLNNILFKAEYDKYCKGDILRWELDSLGFYHSNHPFYKLNQQIRNNLGVEISSVSDLKEDEFDGLWTIKGKQVPKYKLRTIAGTIIDKDKTKGTITLSCCDGVVTIKIYKELYALLDREIAEEDDEGNINLIEESFLEKGCFLLVTGILKGENFVPKVYKNTGFNAIYKICVNSYGDLDYLLKKE